MDKPLAKLWNPTNHISDQVLIFGPDTEDYTNANIFDSNMAIILHIQTIYLYIILLIHRLPSILQRRSNFSCEERENMGIQNILTLSWEAREKSAGAEIIFLNH